VIRFFSNKDEECDLVLNSKKEEEMRAMILHRQAPIEENPLKLEEIPIPEVGLNDVLIKVKVCGVCHTDLHTVEGDIPLHKSPLIPGHQIVGFIEKKGEGVTEFSLGDRVGVPWFYSSCGECKYCKSGRENLCEKARFTGYDVNGGYAEYMKAHKDSVYRIPDVFDDLHAAPLLCGGVIGYRALKLSEAKKGKKLGLYGFGASAHIILQIGIHMGMDVYVFSRSKEHRELAKKLGAVWSGGAEDTPSEKIDSAIIFAPAGWIVKEALRVLDKGGTIALAGIYMTPIPEMEYDLIYYEKTLRSVANSTREDVRQLLEVAAEVPVKTVVQSFRLEEANKALRLVKESKIDGSAVLII